MNKQTPEEMAEQSQSRKVQMAALIEDVPAMEPMVTALDSMAQVLAAMDERVAKLEQSPRQLSNGQLTSPSNEQSGQRSAEQTERALAKAWRDGRVQFAQELEETAQELGVLEVLEQIADQVEAKRSGKQTEQLIPGVV